MRLAGLFVLVILALSPICDARPLMRYPTTSRKEIAFVAYDELWSAPLAGGVAKRLTHDLGAVTTPMFSPDGKWIAFTWRRAGLRDVFVIPAGGGEPRRLTFEASRFSEGAMVVAWTPDSTQIIFLSHRGTPVIKLIRAFSVPVEGGPAELLPLDHAGMMSYSPDGHTVAYNRIFRNLELRKRYIGGQAQDIYTYEFAAHRLTRITHWKGTDTSPMWFARKIYFLSDRGMGFRQNIWSYSLNTKRVQQITHFKNYDIDWPSLGGSTITFQQGGLLYALDLPSEHLRKVSVDVPDDGERTGVRSVPVSGSIRATDAMGRVDYALSPDGHSLLISARGDLLRVAPDKAGEDLTNTPAADEDHPSWSADGKTIAYETDAAKGQQIAIRPANGSSERILTHFPTGYFYTPVWSPLGDSLAVSDANHSLWWIHLDGSAPLRLASDPFAEIRDAAFSPDGRWLAYSTQRANQTRAIHLYELGSGQDTVVSSSMESDRSPIFTPDGRTLLFISQRNEQPFVSDRDDESIIATINSDGLYAVALDPRPTQSASPAGPTPSTGPVRIQLNGLMGRAISLPVTPAVIAAISVQGSEVFYQTKPVQLLSGDLPGQKSMLHALDLVSHHDRIVVDDLDDFNLSSGSPEVAYRRDGQWRIASTETSATADDESIDLSGTKVSVTPKCEWAEMFENAWRLDRDVFFSRVMNGSDWRAVHDAYVKLLPLMGSKDDFLYLLAQMQGEIASSHTFIGHGTDTDTRSPTVTGLLGADYALDRTSGRYSFAVIYKGDPTRSEYASPLGQPGVAVKQGDYLLAVNGRELVAPQTPDQLLSGLSDWVTLTVASSPAGLRHEVKVRALNSDTAVRRHDWIEHNRREVERLSAGKLGYVFLTNFVAEGSKDFIRQFYPQRNKAGLIFDVRWNWGGFTSQAVLDILRRQRAGIFVNREGAISPLPGAVAPKIMTTIMNYGSASDGDQFPFFFRKFGLGKLIGERTWGGVQGINGPWRLMDGSFITIPKDSLSSLDGEWIIENEGVAPDVRVPSAVEEGLFRGDIQLRAAVQTTLAQLRRNLPPSQRAPRPLPAYPLAGNVPGASFIH